MYVMNSGAAKGEGAAPSSMIFRVWFQIFECIRLKNDLSRPLHRRRILFALVENT
jgi:hypothetical protein